LSVIQFKVRIFPHKESHAQYTLVFSNSIMVYVGNNDTVDSVNIAPVWILPCL